RFDLACCTSGDQFRREARAITRAGQIKAPGERHEKDDRHRLDDRSRYVLGWSNQAKIAALEGKSRVLQARLADAGLRIANLQKEQQAVRERLQALDKLEEYRDYSELDWRASATELAALTDEKHRLETASDILKTLATQLQVVEAAIADTAMRLKKREA